MDFLTTYEGLDTAHLAELNTMSAIGEEQIRSRNYQSVTADKLPPQFADYQRRDGLLIPIRTVRGAIENFQLKPNVPRIGKNGKPIKYETAANAPQVIDVPTAALRHLGNPKMPLIITEGAKKVDAAVSAGLVTALGLQGVYGWRGKNAQGGTTALADWEAIALNDRQVLIAFDSDVMTKAGVRDAIERLANFLRSKKAKPCFLVLPDLDDGAKCGLDDWLALGNNPDDLNDHIVAELPAPVKLQVSVNDQVSRKTKDAGIPRLVTRSMDEIEAKEIDWLWPGWLPRGMLSLLGGYAGDGKSTLSVALAAALSRGDALPDGSRAPITNTLLVLAEDDVQHVVKPRLLVHNVDQPRVHTLDHLEFPDGSQRGFNLKTDVAVLRQKVEENEIGLIVIDPLSSVMGSSDRNNEGEVRDTLSALIKMAEQTRCAVLGIMHVGKSDGQAKTWQKLMGSSAYSALARTIVMVSDLPGDYQAEGEPVRKMIGVAKSNYAVAPPPLQYCRPLDGPLQWLGQSPVGINEVYDRLKKDDRGGRGVSETEKAEEWLLEYMDGKRVLASEVETAAKEEGLTMATVNKTKKRMGLMSVREGAQWYWLPRSAAATDAA